MSTYELLDELEAGELSIQFEGEEPQALLEWAIEEFSPRLAISAAFQADDVALIDMAYGIDPNVRIFTVDTGRLAAGDARADRRRCAAKYPGSTCTCSSPSRHRSRGWSSRKGLDLMKESVENRLLCCNVRKVQPLTKHLDGARCLGDGPAPRPVGDAHEHPQGRDRPRPRRDREAEPARRVDEARGVGVSRRARRAGARALRAGLHLDRLRAVHARDRRGRGRSRRPLVVGDERAEGVRHALLDRARRLRARAEGDPRQGDAEGALA